MDWYYIVLICLLSIILLFFITLFICFYLTFYNKNKNYDENKFEIPNDEIYKAHQKIMKEDFDNASLLPYKKLSVKSFDGLILNGKYYEKIKGAPIEIMFHGYRGNAKRDMSSGIKRAFACNRNALIVDQRASGCSQGHIITFGINERKDVIKWIDKVIEEFGNDVKIILTGISMGAATVLNSSNMELKENVIGILADCGYDSAKTIIKKVLKDLKLPVNLFYFLIKTSARIFGNFNLEETSPLEAVKDSKVPIIFYHGTNDNFVPCNMSMNLYNNCSNKNKKLVLIENAGHGIAYLVDPDKYINELNLFYKN